MLATILLFPAVSSVSMGIPSSFMTIDARSFRFTEGDFNAVISLSHDGRGSIIFSHSDSMSVKQSLVT